MTQVAPPPIDVTDTEAALQPERKRRRSHSHRPKWQRRLHRLRNRTLLRNFAVITISLIAVVAVAAAVLITTTVNRAETTLGNLNRILGSLQSRPGTELTLNDVNRLGAGLTEVADALASAQRLAGIVRPIAGIHRDLLATLQSLDAASRLVSAAQNMLTGLEPTIFLLVAGEDSQSIATQFSSGERAVELLRLGRGRFLTAADQLAASRASLDSVNLDGVSPSLLLDVESALNAQSQLEQVNQILLNSPELLTAALGLAGETTYLVLAQNNDELRPSGGYVSTYGWLTLRNGRITDYSFSPTTATSPNPPSAPLPGVEVPEWWIQYADSVYAAWDGSWYADFPSSAAMALEYYNAGGNPQSPVSGAIAIDVSGFELILEALGSVNLPDYDIVVTPANFRTVTYDIRAFGEGELPHKQFIAALYRQIMADWQAAGSDPDVSARLLGALVRAVQEKHVMLYFSDPQINQAVGLLGWSGAQNTDAGLDYLLVADANLGNKSNRSVLRQITYDVELLADQSAYGRVSIDYDYSAQVAELDPAVDEEFHGPLDYTNLLQVFVPAGSTLAASDGFLTEPQVVDSDGHTVFISRLAVPYDSAEHFEYEYQIPGVVADFGASQRYRLLVQKQPGTLAQPATVQIRLPPGATLMSASPTPAASYVLDQPILEFQLTLASDQRVEVIYAYPSSPGSAQ